MEYPFLNPKEVLEAKKNIVRDALKNAPLTLGITYDHGVLFLAENPFLHERLYYTDPVSRTIGFAGTGRPRDVQLLRKYATQQTDMALLQYARKPIGGERNVTARFMAETYVSPGLTQTFDTAQIPLGALVLLSDVYHKELHSVLFDGAHIVKTDVSSLGGDMTDTKPNSVEKYIREKNLWIEDISLEEALAVGVRALVQTQKGTKRAIDYYRDAYKDGALLEVSVLDDRIPGDDKWAPVTPTRNNFYATAPLTQAQAQEIMSCGTREG